MRDEVAMTAGRASGIRWAPALVAAALCALAVSASSDSGAVPRVQWKHLSSKSGDLPVPNGGTQQTACVIADIDGDGVNDIVLAERTQAPAIIWLRHVGGPNGGWRKYVIDDTLQHPEAGGCFYDIDGDGRPDFVIGGDYQSDELWWYRNPAPHFDPKVPWEKHVIKRGGAHSFHDQAWGDFMGTGRAQLAFWNQDAKKLFLAEIPPDPRHAGPWPLHEIWSYAEDPGGVKEEGMFVADVDGDGRPDLLAGNHWYRYEGNGRFLAVQIAPTGGRIAAAKFKPGRYPQIVIAPGDGSGPLMLYECKGNPTDPKAWVGRDLLGRTVIHGHSLQVADIDGDGHLDIFCAEMAKWTEDRKDLDNPNAKAWILYGDGKGGFRTTEFASGYGLHEARVADVNGDGRPDVVSKPYNWETPRLDIWLNEGASKG